AVYAGLVGSVTSMVMQGGTNVVWNRKSKNKVQKDNATNASDTTENPSNLAQNGENNINTPVVENVAQTSKTTQKSATFQKRAERSFRVDIANALETGENHNLTPLIQKATNEIKTTGNISEETANELFERAYSEGYTE